MPADACALALALLDAWNARDLPRLASYLAEDAVWYDPAMPAPPARGRKAVTEFAQAVLRAFPDFRYELRAPLCVAPGGASCVIPWRISATHTAALTPPGYAPTHRRVVLEGLDQLDAQDGKVVRILTCFDVVAAAEQLLDVTIRPRVNSVRQRFVVILQRLFAARARRRGRVSA